MISQVMKETLERGDVELDLIPFATMGTALKFRLPFAGRLGRSDETPCNAADNINFTV